LVTTIGRDAFGKPTSLTRGGTGSSDVVRRYVYDTHQRLCKTIEPESGATVQAYNSANLVEWTASGQNLTSSTDCQQANVANSQKVSHAYDQRRRLKTTTYGDGSPDVRRSYTPDGLLATIASDDSVWTTTYNQRRLSTNETLTLGGVNYAIGYSHSRNGHVAGMTYPDATSVDYAPNALGEATRVGDYARNIATHPNGALNSFTYGNGIAHTTTQSVRGLPERSVDAGVLNDRYAYDANANVTSITDAIDASFTRTMSYDRRDRLVSASAPRWGTRTFGYDALDNLRSMGGGLNWTYQIDANQRLTRIDSGTSALIAYTYDARGRVATRTLSGQPTLTFTTDLADRVTRIAPNGAGYRYDGHGRRTSVTKNGQTTVQVYSQAGQLLYQSAPVNPSDGIFRNGFQQGDTNHPPQAGGNKRYVYLGRHLIAEDGTAGRYYLHTDALGSPVRRTTSAGATSATAREDYQPYGWGPAATSTPAFTGHVADAETGLVYMQARYYDPYAGRFLAVDPIAANELNFNRYWYANDNPYRYIDPDGRCTGSHITNKEGLCVGSGTTTTRPKTAYREFKNSDINIIASPTSKVAAANELSGTLAKDMNRVSDILRREDDKELVDILEKVRLVLDFNTWTAPNLVNAFAQADRRSMTITIAAGRYASLEAMYYRVRNLVHEVRHLTLANDLLPGASDWARNPSERDAVLYAQEIMDKYWSEYVK
ncbi:MAG TPA: RHS repeat-associated core domain-containing protein, partial [Tahibacter sp.]|nr:RHS repeat-associated core domain-containing protein [Tahibacter sp.]